MTVSIDDYYPDFELPEGSELLLDGQRGVYLPKAFAIYYGGQCADTVSPDAFEILEAGPDHELYWEAWEEVLDNAVLECGMTGKRFTLYQDQDLWLIPEEADDES